MMARRAYFDRIINGFYVCQSSRLNTDLCKRFAAQSSRLRHVYAQLNMFPLGLYTHSNVSFVIK